MFTGYIVSVIFMLVSIKQSVRYKIIKALHNKLHRFFINSRVWKEPYLQKSGKYVE